MHASKQIGRFTCRWRRLSGPSGGGWILCKVAVTAGYFNHYNFRFYYLCRQRHQATSFTELKSGREGWRSLVGQASFGTSLVVVRFKSNASLLLPTTLLSLITSGLQEGSCIHTKEQPIMALGLRTALQGPLLPPLAPVAKLYALAAAAASNPQAAPSPPSPTRPTASSWTSWMPCIQRWSRAGWACSRALQVGCGTRSGWLAGLPPPVVEVLPPLLGHLAAAATPSPR